jgi:serine/threonine protein kinase/formylglycine-generating enzyme required for sulfatase activity
MAQPSADHNAFLGHLALLNGFLTRAALDAALAAWQQDRSRPLGQVLVEQRSLRTEELHVLEALVEQHRRRPGGTLPLDATLAPPLGEGSLAPASLPAGVRYRPLRPHARGGLGEVFVALDEELQREVALKEIQARHADNPQSRQRFLLEAEVTGRLEHPGIVPVYGLGTNADGRPFYAMRFIKGNSLQDAIHHYHADKADPSKWALELRQLLGRFVAVCNAVAYAHSKGVLHRDLKPDNVMLGNYGETLVVDWGLAKTFGTLAPAFKPGEEVTPTGSVTLRLSGPESALTQAGHVLGTPAYMSPEQAAGQNAELTPASDVYALGATLYHLLTDRAPFVGDNAYAILEGVCRGQFPRPGEIATVPAVLEAVCLKAMALRPEQRYASAQELAEDVEHWLADEPVAAYPEPLRLRLARWRRRHPALVTGTVALAFTALVALGVGSLLVSREQRAKLAEQDKARQALNERVLAQVDTLLNANPQAVPPILDGLEPYREQVRPELRRVLEESRSVGHRTRAALALLPEDPSQLTFLRGRLLAADVEPEEMLLIRDRLAGHREALARELWGEVNRPDVKAETRFRALVALARFDPDNPHWAIAGTVAVGPLVTAEPVYVGVWSRGLRDVRSALLGPLGGVFRDRSRLAERRVAASVLQDYAADRPDVLADLLMDADPQQYAVLFPRLRPHRDKAVALMHAELQRQPAPTWTESRRDALAQRQANAAVTLLRLGEPERVWPLFRHTPYPDTRTHLLHRLAPFGVKARLVVERLEQETDVSARRALVLSLGEFNGQQLPVALRRRLLPRLLGWYRDNPDPGIHAAVDWLLRHGKEGPLPRPLDWGQAAALASRERQRPKGEPGALATGGTRWYVNGQGQTMVLFPGPVEFFMGSPKDEAGRMDYELLHRRRIGRSLALASKKVTVAQFKRFLKAHPEVKHIYIERYSPDEDGPIVNVTWYEAAQYCRWLSEQESVPEEQMVYPSVADIEKCKNGGTPLKLPRDHLSRTGYRLPTEAEWEHACRAGARSSRYYGSSEEMLGRYAWYLPNARDRAWPVGQKKPNDFGLFDMHGNTWDWCQESAWPYPPGKGGKPGEDEEDIRDVTDRLYRVLRGGAFDVPPRYVRSSYRFTYRPSDRSSSVGLRPARTYR